MFLLFCAVAATTVASEPDEPANGWRGNGTGLWPQARTPLEWGRVPRGAVEGLSVSADRPSGQEVRNAAVVEKGLVRDWLVIGPFPVGDSAADFDRDELGGEPAVEPTAGDTVGGRTWQQATVPPDDPMVFGTAELPWLDVAKVVGFKPSQLANDISTAFRNPDRQSGSRAHDADCDLACASRLGVTGRPR